jgi:iron complex transport system substrate-binding protein
MTAPHPGEDSGASTGSGRVGVGEGDHTPLREEPHRIPSRIASLLPSATEIVCALGLGDRLVLRSHECDHPEWVERIPWATEPRMEPPDSSVAIDQGIQRLIQEGLSIYRVHDHTLKRTAPQVILTQDQCRVCAVPFETIQEAVGRLLDDSTRVVSLSPNDLDSVLGDVLRVAEALAVPERGRALVHQMREAMSEISVRVRRSIQPERELGGTGSSGGSWRPPADEGGRSTPEGMGAAGDPRPRVLTIEWIEPLMVAGNWTPQLVEMAGGENLLGVAGEHSPWVEWSEMRDLDPDLILVMPCGFDLARTREEAGALRGLPGWPELRAVVEGRVALVNGHEYFNRPGPRLVDSLEILVEIFHEGRPGSTDGAPRWEWMEQGM